MKEPLPPGWDWVTARHKCSAVKMFEVLRTTAQKNVETMNALRAESMAGAWAFTSHEDSFSILRRLYGATVGVRFSIAKETILVESYDQATKFEVALTLDDEGECRFLVKGDTRGLDCWQMLRRALEPSFFGPAP
jgi:hypothetical protein